MNILYVSSLEGGKYTGPIYSVPNQIEYQGKYDTVYWINVTKIDNSNLFDSNFYHYVPWRLFDFSNLPKPFNKPDIIVFQEFFKIGCCFIARKAEKLNIPYIIIPRCQMTENYLKNKRLKKLIASKILFKHFAQKSLSVQFLSEQEKKDSQSYYSGKSYVIPNGIKLQKESANFKQKTITGTFIGRYSLWQKGLDLLIEAIYKERDIIKKHNISFQLYGPNDRTSFPDKVRSLVEVRNLSEIVHVNSSVFDDEKKKVLLNSFFFVHTSRFEGMPMSVLEALSYGVPCIVTQGSNMREAIVEFNAGWGADNNIESIRETLRELCTSIDSFSIKGNNAKKLAAEFSWDLISKKTHEIYKNYLKL